MGSLRDTTVSGKITSTSKLMSIVYTTIIVLASIATHAMLVVELGAIFFIFVVTLFIGSNFIYIQSYIVYWGQFLLQFKVILFIGANVFDIRS